MERSTEVWAAQNIAKRIEEREAKMAKLAAEGNEPTLISESNEAEVDRLTADIEKVLKNKTSQKKRPHSAAMPIARDIAQLDPSDRAKEEEVFGMHADEVQKTSEKQTVVEEIRRAEEARRQAEEEDKSRGLVPANALRRFLVWLGLPLGDRKE